MAAKKPMGESPRKILAVLKEAGVGVAFDTRTMMDACGFEKPGSVTGSVTSLVNKGLAVRYKEPVTDEKGKTKEVSKFALTEEGMNFDPDAEIIEG